MGRIMVLLKILNLLGFFSLPQEPEECQQFLAICVTSKTSEGGQVHRKDFELPPESPIVPEQMPPGTHGQRPTNMGPGPDYSRVQGVS